MPFSIVNQNIRGRFSEVHSHLEFIGSLEPEGLGSASSQVKILRGFYYVHLYAFLERSINEIVEQALLIVDAQSIPNMHYNFQFNVISLNSKMQAFKAAGYKDYLVKSIEVFRSVGSEENFKVSNTVFSSSLQNVWYDTIQQVLACFGIQAIDFNPRMRLTVNEVVEKRNAVAHGRESPLAVGERHDVRVLRQKTSEIQQVVDLVVRAFEDFISQKGYIQGGYLELYGAS